MTARPTKDRLAALAAAVLLCASPLAARATKSDARLRVLRGAARGASVAAVGAGTTAPPVGYRVLVRVVPGTTLSDLRAAYPGAVFVSAAGEIISARVAESDLAAFDSDPRIVSVEAGKKLHPTLDVVRSNATSGGLYLGTTRNAAATDLANADGSGVVIGIVDSGIDFRHLDFVDAGTGQSRVKYLWDQTDAAGPAPSGFACTNQVVPFVENDCGSEWTNAQLNASLPGGGPVRQTDTLGHGTHVASIAAGNGRAGGGPLPSFTFVGMAPKADLIIVKSDFSTPGIIDGVNYILARAAALGKRAVINLSLGGQIDPHDGSSNLDLGVAAVAASTPVVVAMGNDGTLQGSAPHAQSGALAQGQTVTFNAVAQTGSTAAELDLWTGLPSAASQSAFTVTVTVNGSACVTKADGQGTNGTPVVCSGQQVYLENRDALVGVAGGGNTFGSGTNTNNDREIYAAVVNNAGFGANVTISLALTCTNAAGCGTIDAYADSEGELTNFTSCAGGSCSLPATGTMGSPATANGVVSVGSYASKISWTDLAGTVISYTDGQTAGAISKFSSWGPTRDGRTAPLVAAPGEGIGAALSTNATICPSCTFSSLAVLQDDKHAILQGTSMATPVVTGILATRIQPGVGDWRSVADLKALLQTLARSDASVASYGALPNAVFGYGKVVASPQPIAAPSALSATALGLSSVTWSWSTALPGADSYDVYYATNPVVPLASAIKPPFVQTGLLPDAVASLLVRGVGGGIEGPSATVSTATFAAAPGLPLTVSGFTSSATATFAACTAAPDPASCSGYILQAGVAPDFTGASFSSATPARTLTTLSVTGLTANAAYFLRLGTLNPLGAVSWGPYTTFNTGTNTVAPNNPVLDQATTSSIRFGWSQNTNPAGLTYVAQASTMANFTGTLLSTASVTLSQIFSGLTADTSYYFRAQAVGGPFLVTGPSATVPLPPAASAAPFPAVGTNAITVAWSAGGDQPDTLYQADLSPASDFSTGLQRVQTRATAAAFAGLTPNTLYYARAAAVARTGGATSFLSVGSTVTLVQAPTLGAQPFSSQAVDGFAFSFINPGNPAGTGYLVQVAPDPAFATVVAAANTASTTASFSGLLSNQVYYARVAGLNSAGTPTAFVSASTATAVSVPSAPTVTARTTASLDEAWAAGALAAGTRYLTQASSSPVFAFAVVSSNTANASATLGGLLANTTYYGRLQALSQNPPTPDGAFIPVGPASTLANPPGAAAQPFAAVFYTSATASWLPLPAAPANAAAEGYLVQFSTDSGFNGTPVVATAPALASSATVTGLAYGTFYYARVGSLSWDGQPDWLTLGTTTTALPPLASGKETASGLTLTLPPAFAEVTDLTVWVPPGAFPVGTLVTAVASFSQTLTNARSNEAKAITPLGSAVAIDLSAGGLQPAVPVRVTLSYDTTKFPVGQDERRLNLWRYDPPTAQWTLTPSQADPASHALTAAVQHFSTFAPFFTTPASALDSVQVFPVPWEITAPSSQFWAQTLTFSGMPASSRVRLFTLTGEAVFDGTADGGGTLSWDGNTRFGRRAASGTYYAVIEGGGQKVVRRVVVIR